MDNTVFGMIKTVNQTDPTVSFNLASTNEFKALGLPTWYHQCLALLYSHYKHNTQHIVFYDFDRLKDEYTDAWTRKYKQMFIAQRYSGMGYYYLIGVFLDKVTENSNCKAFFTIMLGGSNGFDRDVNYKEFMSRMEDNFELVTLDDAVHDILHKEY